MSIIVYNAALFTQIAKEGKMSPQLTGHVSIPVDRIDELITLLQSQRVFEDQGVATVRLPLAFWAADPKSAPKAFNGQCSFMATAATSVSRPAVDAAPAY